MNFTGDEYSIIYARGKRARGVGVISDKGNKKCVLGCWQLSDIVLLVKLYTTIIIFYAPASQITGKEIRFTIHYIKANVYAKIIIIRKLSAKVEREARTVINRQT